jgi:regulator of replication initiation timing
MAKRQRIKEMLQNKDTLGLNKQQLQNRLEDEQTIIDSDVNAESAFENDSVDNIDLSDGEDSEKLSTGAKIEKAFKKF